LWVSLTALLGGLLAPIVKELIDRRERLDASVQLVETLAKGLWAYWKFALRVASYGRQGDRSKAEYEQALRKWDGDEAWQLGCDIQIQVSRSKRLLSPESQRTLDHAQQNVVDYLDRQVDDLRVAEDTDLWKAFYAALMADKRSEIDELLNDVTEKLNLGRKVHLRQILRL